MKKIMTVCSAVMAVFMCSYTGSDAKVKPSSVEQGKYLITIAGCNDCHTDGYGDRDGQVPVEDWLQGSPLGWKGPWGTTYAANLRKFITALTEDQWVEMAGKLKTRPPMPWFNVNRMKENDLRAIYQFVSSLAPSDAETPEYQPPEKETGQPYVQFPMQ